MRASWGRWARHFRPHPAVAGGPSRPNPGRRVAYNNHDVDDGLRSGLITLGGCRVGIFARHYAEVAPVINWRRAATSETIRRMINTLIVDLTATSQHGASGAEKRHFSDR